MAGVAACFLSCAAVLGLPDPALEETAGGDATTADVTQTDADTREDAGSDGATDAARSPCDLGKPFRPPVPVAGAINSNQAEKDPSLTADELTMYFARLGSVDFDIYVATRASRDAGFGPPTPVPINSQAFDGDPLVTADGGALYFSSVRPAAQGGMGGADIYLATRDGTGFGGFGPPTLVPGINSPANDGQIFPNLIDVFFASSRDLPAGAPPGDTDIFHATFLNGEATSVTRVTDLSSVAAEAFPVLTADGSRIFFASGRGSNSPTPLDIWTAARTAPSKFAAATPVAELNSTSDDAPRWISSDGCRLYMQSTRSGNYDIYVASRPEL